MGRKGDHMRITDLLDKNSICLDASPADKTEALNQIVSLMGKSGKINDIEAYRKQVFLREEESTTGIGEGIAIPHGKCDAVTKPGLAAMVVKDGVDFDSLDGKLVHTIIMIASGSERPDWKIISRALSKLPESEQCGSQTGKSCLMPSPKSGEAIIPWRA